MAEVQLAEGQEGVRLEVMGGGVAEAPRGEELVVVLLEALEVLMAEALLEAE